MAGHQRPGNDRRVALRKESVDRNVIIARCKAQNLVALRKESVDRNVILPVVPLSSIVALRKESVDRNVPGKNLVNGICLSLSARRAWIEI